jgi:hypothetical protein
MISPLGGRALWLKFYTEHFYLLNMRLLILHSLRVDVHGDFHSIGTDPVVALSSLEASLTCQYSVGYLNPTYM